MVKVVPVTHSVPDDLDTAMELPSAVKRHLGLDETRSWVMLDEINQFAWPGFDLRPIPLARDRFAYGFLPPRFFEQLILKQRNVWNAGQGHLVPRD